jgi:hypothetical protein
MQLIWVGRRGQPGPTSRGFMWQQLVGQLRGLRMVVQQDPAQETCKPPNQEGAKQAGATVTEGAGNPGDVALSLKPPLLVFGKFLPIAQPNKVHQCNEGKRRPWPERWHPALHRDRDDCHDEDKNSVYVVHDRLKQFAPELRAPSDRVTPQFYRIVNMRSPTHRLLLPKLSGGPTILGGPV